MSSGGATSSRIDSLKQHGNSRSGVALSRTGCGASSVKRQASSVKRRARCPLQGAATVDGGFRLLKEQPTGRCSLTIQPHTDGSPPAGPPNGSPSRPSVAPSDAGKRYSRAGRKRRSQWLWRVGARPAVAALWPPRLASFVNGAHRFKPRKKRHFAAFRTAKSAPKSCKRARRFSPKTKPLFLRAFAQPPDTPNRPKRSAYATTAEPKTR